MTLDQLSFQFSHHEPVLKRTLTGCWPRSLLKGANGPPWAPGVGQRGPWGVDPAIWSMRPHALSIREMNVEGDHFFCTGSDAKWNTTRFQKGEWYLGGGSPLAGFLIIWSNYLAKSVMKLENFRVIRRLLLQGECFLQTGNTQSLTQHAVVALGTVLNQTHVSWAQNDWTLWGELSIVAVFFVVVVLF